MRWSRRQRLYPNWQLRTDDSFPVALLRPRWRRDHRRTDPGAPSNSFAGRRIERPVGSDQLALGTRVVVDNLLEQRTVRAQLGQDLRRRVVRHQFDALQFRRRAAHHVRESAEDVDHDLNALLGGCFRCAWADQLDGGQQGLAKRFFGVHEVSWLFGVGGVRGAASEHQRLLCRRGHDLAGIDRLTAGAARQASGPNERPVRLRAKSLAEQFAITLSLKIDRQRFSAGPVPIPNLPKVIERSPAFGGEDFPGFHREGVQVVDQFHGSTVSIDKEEVKRLIIYQMIDLVNNPPMDIYQYRRERLLELIDAEYERERVKFCDRTGISESRLAQLLSTTYRNGTAFTEKTARKVEEMAGLPPMYFDQGAAPASMSLADLPKEAYQPVEVHHQGNLDVVLVPRVDIAVRAGISGFAIDGGDSDDLDTYPLERRWLERNNYAQSRLIAMRVKGDSMFPLYKEGDIIVINTAEVKPVDGKEFVVNFGGDVVLKRMTRDAGSWWLTSENPEARYHRRIVRGTETMIIGRVVKHDRINL